MSLISQLYQSVVSLTERVNLWENNAKSNEELPVMNPIDRTALNRVSKDNVSKVFTIQELINDIQQENGATKEHFLNLSGIDTSVSELDYVASAIITKGEFLKETGEQMVFQTSVVIGTDQSDYGILKRWYRFKRNDNNVGGVTGFVVTDNDIMPDGRIEINLQDNSDLFIDLGVINNPDTVESVFNLGILGEPYVIVGEQFITGILDGVDTIWRFNGGDGAWGGDDVGDPEYLAATAVMFDNLSLQPDTDPNVGIPEAPIDGFPYSRQDADWVKAFTGYLGISETGNPADLDYVLKWGDYLLEGSGVYMELNDGNGGPITIYNTFLKYDSAAFNNPLIDDGFIPHKGYVDNKITVYSANFTADRFGFHNNTIEVDGAFTATLPLTLAVPVGSFCYFIQKGAGTSVLTAAAGVKINGVDGKSLNISNVGQYGGLRLYKTAVYEYIGHYLGALI